MFLYYLDESYNTTKFVISAIRIPTEEWRETYGILKEFRRDLKAKYGIYVNKELHARDFVSGRGKISHKTVPKGLRAYLFEKTLELVTSLPVEFINACIDCGGNSDPHLFALERILNRIQVNARKDERRFVLIICPQSHFSSPF